MAIQGKNTARRATLRNAWMRRGYALMMEGREELGWGFHGQISRPRFAGFSCKSVGTFDATFDIPLTFDLNDGFSTPSFDLSRELPIFANLGSNL